jgi:hypothetical protein
MLQHLIEGARRKSNFSSLPRFITYPGFQTNGAAKKALLGDDSMALK